MTMDEARFVLAPTDRPTAALRPPPVPLTPADILAALPRGLHPLRPAQRLRVAVRPGMPPAAAHEAAACLWRAEARR